MIFGLTATEVPEIFHQYQVLIFPCTNIHGHTMAHVKYFMKLPLIETYLLVCLPNHLSGYPSSKNLIQIDLSRQSHFALPRKLFLVAQWLSSQVKGKKVHVGLTLNLWHRIPGHT
jgi:hypothetical protein